MIPLFKVNMAPEAASAVARVLASGQVAQGPEVDAFEQDVCRALGAAYDSLVTVNSCTSALHLAFHMIGLGPGDLALVTPMTCAATVAALVQTGARPFWCDVDPVSGLIDPVCVEQIVKDLRGGIKAVVAVDWGGQSCDYDALRAAAPGIPIVEDAAHAFGATRNGIPIAQSGGDYVCWSLQAIKHLTTGDGGILQTPPDQTERARRLRWFGYDRRAWASFRFEQKLGESGFKYHMNDIAAAIGRANLPLALDAVEKHRLNASIYDSALAGIRGVERPPASKDSAWWLYTLRVADRPSFMAWMREHGVETSPVHLRCDLHPAFQRHAVWPTAMPGLDAFAEHEVAIPVGWWLEIDDLTRIIAAVEAWSWNTYRVKHVQP